MPTRCLDTALKTEQTLVYAVGKSVWFMDCITIGLPDSPAGWSVSIRLTQTATSPQRKPLLDEASFQQLLQAAHVLQEHNDRLRSKGSAGRFRGKSLRDCGNAKTDSDPAAGFDCCRRVGSRESAEDHQRFRRRHRNHRQRTALLSCRHRKRRAWTRVRVSLRIPPSPRIASVKDPR